MHPPKTILVPTDFSTCAEQAVRYGLTLAKQLEARVYLMHAWTMPYSRWDEQSESPHEVPPQLEAAARAALETVSVAMRRELPAIETLFYVGDPCDSILQAAADVQADIIVVGTHGRRGLARMLEGSIAESVTRRAPCPVLAIRHQLEEPRTVRTRTTALR